MKILMLGWEYPPHISGGLGTACEGLTVALARQGVAVDFVLPRLTGEEKAPHMRLTAPGGSGAPDVRHAGTAAVGPAEAPGETEFVSVPAYLSPYWGEDDYRRFRSAAVRAAAAGLAEDAPSGTVFSRRNPPLRRPGAGRHYGTDLFAEVGRYAGEVGEIAATRDFDVVHAHDWMTIPAGISVAARHGKPLVVHLHSLERDRSGAGVNRRIADIERDGANAATAVIAVSHYTKTLVASEYGVAPDRIHIVHNGVYPKEALSQYRRERGKERAKTVLFLGRITFQKGPEYLVQAAARVVPHVPDVEFVMAGSGDLLPHVIERVRTLGLEANFRFPGFLKGGDVDRVFSLADVYVMPSVSEPFGISALEAISFDTPVIISKQSGVSEVLEHALKVDFWDTDRLADLIINALVHDELRDDMASMAREELKRLRWDAAAAKTREVYAVVTGRAV